MEMPCNAINLNAENEKTVIQTLLNQWPRSSVYSCAYKIALKRP